jgi:hypothetical protein
VKPLSAKQRLGLDDQRSGVVVNEANRFSVLRALDQWTRRRLRAIAWKQWKHGPARFAELTSRGVDRLLAAQTAGSPHGVAHQSQPSPGACFHQPRFCRARPAFPGTRGKTRVSLASFVNPGARQRE